jgi:hypothetical protein
MFAAVTDSTTASWLARHEPEDLPARAHRIVTASRKCQSHDDDNPRSGPCAAFVP